ncbi:LOW QUALITY PROTEIN: hypothetical protein YC2023_108534 [Brassica napus]
MLMYTERRLALSTLISSNTGGTTRPVKAKSISPTEETSRPVLTKGGPGDPSQVVSQAPSPDSNPNSPSPVTTMKFSKEKWNDRDKWKISDRLESGQKGRTKPPKEGVYKQKAKDIRRGGIFRTLGT